MANKNTRKFQWLKLPFLKTYKEVSGQIINLSKSSLMANKNTSQDKVSRLSEILEISKADKLGKYLGLPSQTKRNKQRVFKKIKERM